MTSAVDGRARSRRSAPRTGPSAGPHPAGERPRRPRRRPGTSRRPSNVPRRPRHGHDGQERDRPSGGPSRDPRPGARRPRTQPALRATPDSSNVAISRCSAPAASISGSAISAPGRLTEAQAQVEQRLEPELVERHVGAQARPSGGRRSGFRRRRSEPDGRERGDGRGVAVEQHRQAQARRFDRGPAQRRRARGPRTRAGPRAPGRRRPVALEGGGDDARACVRARPASTPVPRPTVELGGAPVSAPDERGRRRGVADADLAEDQAVDAAARASSRASAAPPQRCVELRFGASAGSAVMSAVPGGDLGVSDARPASAPRGRRRRRCSSCPPRRREHADRGLTARRRGGHLRGDVASNRLVPWST